MKKKRKKEDDIWDYEPKYYLQGFYVILTCGLIIFSIGLYLTITNSVATGYAQPGRFSRSGAYQTLNGPVTLFLGCIVLGFSIITFFSRSKGSKKQETDKDSSKII
jgi:hypothetical protein